MKGVVTIKRRSFASIIAICLIMLFSMTVHAATPVTPKTNYNYKGTDIAASIETIYRTDKAYFKDEADILTAASEKELWEKLEAAADYLNIRIAVFIGGNYRTDDETPAFTVNSTNAIFGSQSDALFIYLDFEGYSPAYDYIRAFNKAEEIYPETKRNKILNVMYQKLPKSTEPVYEDAVRQAISLGLDEVKSQGYVNPVRASTPTYSSTPQTRPAPQTPQAQPEEKPTGIEGFFKSLPPAVIYGGIAVIVVLILLVIFSSIGKHSSRRSYNNTYYDDGYRRSNYHSSYRSRSYRSRPPRDYGPPRHSRPPHHSAPPQQHHSGPSNNSSSGSSNSPHSSGSGHYR